MHTQSAHGEEAAGNRHAQVPSAVTRNNRPGHTALCSRLATGLSIALGSHSISVPGLHGGQDIPAGASGRNGIMVVRDHASNAGERQGSHRFGANDSVLFILIYLIQIGIVCTPSAPGFASCAAISDGLPDSIRHQE
jgi:hypothetical protein